MTSDNPGLLRYDVLIIGSGLAGLSAALLLADSHRVAIVTKQALNDGSSAWAQGGMAAVLAEGDSMEQHIGDTLVAGAGLCDPAAAQAVVEGAPAAVAWLRSLGVPFTEDAGAPGTLHLTREGGHGRRRIVHAADATGAAVQGALIARMREHPGITLLEDHMLVDTLTDRPTAEARCCGARVLDIVHGHVKVFVASHTILATGGGAKVYLHSTNPDTATGDGIAAAWRAGCRIANMEFMQFHPTSLHHPDAGGFLITEAVRGEGGRLLLPASCGAVRFMPRHDDRAELAPRDVVARAIDLEMKEHGTSHVCLDISHRDRSFVLEHFPNIYKRCLALGIDITREPIPVVPAAHYTCGGVVTDLAGRTDVPGLYAIGETACTGLHGANRLASNSLVECVVLARAAARAIAADARAPGAVPIATPDLRREEAAGPADRSRIAALREELQRLMWNDVGIVRNTRGLAHAAERIAGLQREADALRARMPVGREGLELRNLLQVASLIVQSAQQRAESRGLHFTQDHPQTARLAVPTILEPAFLAALQAAPAAS